MMVNADVEALDWILDNVRYDNEDEMEHIEPADLDPDEDDDQYPGVFQSSDVAGLQEVASVLRMAHHAAPADTIET